MKFNGLENLNQAANENLDDESRLFVLHDQNGKEFEVRTKNVGSIDDIYESLNRDGEKKIETPVEIHQIIDIFKNYKTTFKKSGKEVEKRPHLLITGGFLRDVVLNHAPNDIDLATDLSSTETFELLKENLNNVKNIGVHGEISTVVRVKFNNGEEYEISTFKRSDKGENENSISPGEDSLARDLTVNAIFYNPTSGNIIDYANGMNDIKNGVLKFTNSPDDRIKEDPIRILRYIRFLLKTGFKVDEAARESIKKNLDKLDVLAKERIRDELEKIIVVSSPRGLIERFDEFGMLEKLFPEIKDLENCKQGPPYHLEGDVLTHTKMVSDNLPADSSPRLKWATIFHDISKPETRDEIEVDGKKKVSFLGHDSSGAEKSRKVLKRLDFSGKDIEEISWIVLNHQTIFQKVSRRIMEASVQNKDNAKRKAKNVIIKMFYEVGRNDILRKAKDEKEKIGLDKKIANTFSLIKDLVYLAMADTKGKISEEGNGETDANLIYEVYCEAEKEIHDLMEDKKMSIEKLLSGKLVMEFLGIKQGPEVGKIRKAAIKIIRDEGVEFKDKQEADNYIKKVLEDFRK